MDVCIKNEKKNTLKNIDTLAITESRKKNVILHRRTRLGYYFFFEYLPEMQEP